jgi:multisubunit Na+/H+ antiporter MnhB subunit
VRWRPSLILTVCINAAFPLALVLSLFLLFAGHNAPGGGFVGGLVAGAALVLRFVDRGTEGLDASLPLPPATLLGGGLLVAAATGAVPLLFGQNLLEHDTWTATLPLLGSVKATSALPFDIGVYLVVVGLVAGALHAFGSEEAA